MAPDRRHLIWVVLPVLPVFLGFCLLNVLSNGSMTLLADAIPADNLLTDAPQLRFFNAMLVFGAVGLFQVIGCFAVAVFAASRVHQMPATLRTSALTVFAASLVLVALISFAARQPFFDGALTLAYRTTCTALVDAKLGSHLLPGECDENGLSHLAWLGLLPYMAGILAAAAASAAVSVAPRIGDLNAWADLLEQAFRATAFVLVASTITMMLFYYLPQALVATSDDTKTTHALVSDFAQGMTLFWGIVFSLTLLAVFGPAHLLLSRAVAREEAAGTDLKKQMAERSLTQQATRVLTTLAPVIVGSSASIIDLLSGAFGG